MKESLIFFHPVSLISATITCQMVYNKNASYLYGYKSERCVFCQGFGSAKLSGFDTVLVRF
jgi:hypothetical protein